MKRAALTAVVLLSVAAATPAAAQSLQVALTPAAPPLANAVTHGLASSVSFDVTNALAGRNLRRLDFQLPTGFTVQGGVAPSGWTVTTTGPTRTISFRFTGCTGSGVAPGTTGTFVLDVRPTGTVAADQPETLASIAPSDPCTGFTGWSVTTPVTFQRKVLRVTGGTVTPAGALAPPAAVSVSWTVQNRSSQAKNGVSLQRVVTPSSYAGDTCTPNGFTLAAGASQAVTCTYSLTAPATYTIAVNAAGSPNASAVGATTSIAVGNASVVWARPVAVRGRAATYSFSIQLVNDSGLTVNRLEVMRPDATWTGMSNAGATGLGYNNGCSSAGTMCYRGSLAPGATATVAVQFTGVPNVAATTDYTFNVRVTPTTGTAVTLPQAVHLVVPLPDVSGLTVLSDAGGQTFSWTNTSGPGSPHDGVVVFRTTPPALPPAPQDFVDYTGPTRPATVVYADGGGSTARDFADPVVGKYYYRVCNHDAYLVYSGCSTGFWNGRGYVDSQIAPAGGWTHQLGGDATRAPSLVSGNRVSVTTNRPAVAVLDVASGHRSFDPVSIVSLPSSNTPTTRLVNGRLVLFAADQSGSVTAVDVEAGTVYWQTTKAGESFVAGVSGITRAYATAAFQSSYPMDLLLLGSATTGNVLAVDATTGNTLWTVAAGAQVRALITYDSNTNRFYVPTVSGVAAFDLTGSGPSAATPAAALSGWTNPGSSYSLYCARTFDAASLACIDRSGVLHLLNNATGAERTSIATGLTSPTTLVRFSGTTPGFVVGDSSRIVRVAATATPAYALSSTGVWTPSGSVRVSSAQVLGVSGYIYVSASDGSAHKLRLADASEIPPASSPIPTASGALLLGPIVYDTAHGLIVFGTSEGRVWALPTF